MTAFTCLLPQEEHLLPLWCFFNATPLFPEFNCLLLVSKLQKYKKRDYNLYYLNEWIVILPILHLQSHFRLLWQLHNEATEAENESRTIYHLSATRRAKTPTEGPRVKSSSVVHQNNMSCSSTTKSRHNFQSYNSWEKVLSAESNRKERQIICLSLMSWVTSGHRARYEPLSNLGLKDRFGSKNPAWNSRHCGCPGTALEGWGKRGPP